jgi:FkbM family methyltransferase
LAFDLFNRLLNASPRSVAGWVGRRLGFSSPQHTSATLPTWERITAGPLAGREVLIDRRSNGAWEDMIAGRFDVEIYSFLANVLPARDVVMWDVGAHIGFHTLGFALIVGPSGHVVGFEPNSSNRERLEQNLKRNSDLAAHITILPCALSDRDGDASLVISRDIESGASSMSFLDGTTPSVDPGIAREWNKIVVPVRTADALVREGTAAAPHIIKIDVEGAELLVLRGAEQTMRTNRPMLIVEAHSAHLAVETQRWLHEQGYEIQVLADLAPSRVLLSARRADST